MPCINVNVSIIFAYPPRPAGRPLEGTAKGRSKYFRTQVRF